MRRSIGITIVVVLTCLASALPAAAGGWAVVRLDPSSTTPTVDAPWTVGFMVMRHGVTPFNADPVHLDARHRETGQLIRADAHQDGAVGHYVAEVIFPRAGAWKWSITPEPFEPTSFEPLTVLGPSTADERTTGEPVALHPAVMHRGTCASPGDVAFPLSTVRAGAAPSGASALASRAITATAAQPVSMSATTIDTSLAELTRQPHAIDIKKSDHNSDTDVACGDIAGQTVNGDLVVGLQQRHNSGDVGVALLHSVEARQTTVTILMIVVDEQSPPSGSTATVTIDLGPTSGGWGFEPADIEVPVGSTVTWENHTDAAHTITGDDLAFADSGPLDPGQTYAQTFTEPGVYHYRCGPHPWMTGTVTVH